MYSFQQFINDVKGGSITNIAKIRDYANFFLFNLSEYGEIEMDEEGVRSIEEAHNV